MILCRIHFFLSNDIILLFDCNTITNALFPDRQNDIKFSFKGPPISQYTAKIVPGSSFYSNWCREMILHLSCSWLILWFLTCTADTTTTYYYQQMQDAASVAKNAVSYTADTATTYYYQQMQDAAAVAKNAVSALCQRKGRDWGMGIETSIRESSMGSDANFGTSLVSSME